MRHKRVEPPWGVVSNANKTSDFPCPDNAINLFHTLGTQIDWCSIPKLRLMAPWRDKRLAEGVSFIRPIPKFPTQKPEQNTRQNLEILHDHGTVYPVLVLRKQQSVTLVGSACSNQIEKDESNRDLLIRISTFAPPGWPSQKEWREKEICTAWRYRRLEHMRTSFWSGLTEHRRREH